MPESKDKSETIISVSYEKEEIEELITNFTKTTLMHKHKPYDKKSYNYTPIDVKQTHFGGYEVRFLREEMNVGTTSVSPGELKTCP